MKIGIVTFQFSDQSHDKINSFIRNIKENFCPNIDKKIFVFTTEDEKYDDSVIIKKLPCISYFKDKCPMKYIEFQKHITDYREYDYVYYIDCRLRFLFEVNEEVLCSSIGVLHPGYIEKDESEHSYDRNSSSSACIEIGKGKNYYFDTIVGGSCTNFIKTVNIISDLHSRDYQNKVVALWGDESYLNKYFLYNEPKLKLSPEYSEIRKHKLSEAKGKFEENNKIDLTDMTFTIPIRIDSQDRRLNIELLVEYLTFNFNTNIIIGEESNKPAMKHLESKCKYINYKQDKPFFWRTRLLNNLAREATTPFISNYDCDIFLKVKDYSRGLELLRNGTYDFVYPFNGNNVLMPRFYYTEIKQKMDIERLEVDSTHRDSSIGYGCVIFQNKEKFIKSGMENENFKSWGPEDYERHYRYKKLGYRVGRLNDTYCYHLNHVRGPDSSKDNPYFRQNEREYEKVQTMNKDKLKQYISTWEWAKK